MLTTPLTSAQRVRNYLTQNGRRVLTARQLRRINHKNYRLLRSNQ